MTTTTDATIIVRGHQYWATTATGEAIAMATFAPPRRAEDGPEVMRQRAEWIARYPGARVVYA